MSEQPQRPTSDDDREGWTAYWTAQGMSWRTEPEIDGERQRYLAERRAVKPDIGKGIYPLRDENGSIKLTRADVEWLLATHEMGRGPIEWSQGLQHHRTGLDLRGSDLRALDLRHLPLACLQAGLADEGWDTATYEQRELAAVHMEGTILAEAQLQASHLAGAHLEGANLFRADMEDADLHQAFLRGANLYRTQLKESWLMQAHLEGANLYRTRLEGVYLRQAHLEGTFLPDDEYERIRKSAPGFPQLLPPADLRRAFFESATVLDHITLGEPRQGAVRVADVNWGAVNFGVVDLQQIGMLGDEREARTRVHKTGQRKDRSVRLVEYAAAVRANRQLASVLRQQGIPEQADRFAYRSHLLQRRVLRLQRHYLRASGSWLLGCISGYGHRPLRSLITYIVVVGAFAGVYALLAHFGLTAEHFGSWDSPLVLSVTSFHGRVFFAGGLQLTDWAARVGAVEAAIGLLVEIIFIATFTQRFFAR